jgi:hypothetical protein
MAFNSGYNNQGRFNYTSLPPIPHSAAPGRPPASSQEQSKDFPAPVARQPLHSETGKATVSRYRSRLEPTDHYGPLQQNTSRIDSPDTPSALTSSEWDYVHRTVESWYNIKHASEMKVAEEYSKTTVPGHAYRLLGDAMNRSGLQEKSKIAIMGFLRNWPKRSDCPGTMHDDWKTFVQKSSSISKAPEDEYVYPAGNFSVPQPLSVIWDYPTYSTRQPYNILTADTTNPCTRMLLRKGMNPSRTPMVWLEVLHRRLSTKDTKCSKSPMQMIDPKEAQHAREFLRKGLKRARSRVGLLLGRHAQEEYEKHQRTHPLLKLQLAGHNPDWPIHVWVDGNPAALNIKQVMVCCEHTQAIFHRHARGLGVGKHMDEAIRIACELAGLQINLNARYFEWMENERIKKGRDGWNFSAKDSPISMLNKMLKYENEGAAELPKVPYSQINHSLRMCYRKWTGENDDSEEAMRKYFDQNDLCPPHHVSIVKGLHALMILKSIAANAALGYPNLAAGRAAALAAGHATQAAAGWPSLAAGRATMAAAGHPELVAGRAAHAAAGYPGLAAGRATMAAAGYPGLAAGRAKVAANAQISNAQKTQGRIAAGKDMWLCQADPEECRFSASTYKGYSMHMKQVHNEYWQTAVRGAKNCMYQRPKITLKFPARLLSSAEDVPGAQ